MIENPMISGLDAHYRKEENRDENASRCFELHVAEMLNALNGDQDGEVSYFGARVPLWRFIDDFFQSDAVVSSFLKAMRERRSMHMWLAEEYAEAQTDHAAEQGELDV